MVNGVAESIKSFWAIVFKASAIALTTLEIFGLKFDVLEKLDTNENNLAKHRLNEINLDNSSASKYLINKLKEF